MLPRVRLRLRSVAYALRGGFLVRPLVIAVVLGLAGAVLSSVEEAAPALSRLGAGDAVPVARGPAGGAGDPQRDRARRS